MLYYKQDRRIGLSLIVVDKTKKICYNISTK
nr:MAG TPA: hypothetical protein [Caudoviricetes sp.]